MYRSGRGGRCPSSGLTGLGVSWGHPDASRVTHDAPGLQTAGRVVVLCSRASQHPSLKAVALFLERLPGVAFAPNALDFVR